MDTIEAHAGELSGVRIHQMDRSSLGPTCSRVRRSLRHVDYYLGLFTPGLLGWRMRPGAQPLLGDAAAPCVASIPAGDRPPRQDRQSRLLQPWHQRRLRRRVHRGGAVLPRGHRRATFHLRADPIHVSQVAGLDPHQCRFPTSPDANRPHWTTPFAATSRSCNGTGPAYRSASDQPPTRSSARSPTTATSASTRRRSPTVDEPRRERCATGARKTQHRNKHVTTFTVEPELMRWLDHNAAVELMPVD